MRLCGLGGLDAALLMVRAASLLRWAGTDHARVMRGLAEEFAALAALPPPEKRRGPEEFRRIKGSAKLSARWYEFDIGWMYIRMLEMLGLARVKKTIPTPKFGIAKARADFDTLQAIITCRYDVMTRYVQSLKVVAQEEFSALKIQPGGKLSVKELRRWLAADESELAPDEKSRLAFLLQSNSRLQTVVTMRKELTALWARSTATREQLLQDLQDWIARAEKSGIQQLEDFSLRLRRYAV